MTVEHLCTLLELPTEVSNAVTEYRRSHTDILTDTLREECSSRSTWDHAINQISERIGEDPNGFFMLAELLDIACSSYEKYQKLGIDDSVFTQTMKFLTRFIREHKKLYGHYAFTWAWWFPRQLALQEFRIGELEFEFVDDKEKQIFIHIPSDADMKPSSLEKTFQTYRSFLNRYYPSWTRVPWYCESWMLSPALRELLPKSSNIRLFQERFSVESVDEESMAVLDWVYPGESGELSSLSERTQLQKNMKNYLLSGKKVGWAKGKFVDV